MTTTKRNTHTGTIPTRPRSLFYPTDQNLKMIAEDAQVLVTDAIKQLLADLAAGRHQGAVAPRLKHIAADLEFLQHRLDNAINDYTR